MSDNQFNFGPTVISNSLNDSSTTRALSAAKGKELSESIIKPITIDLDTVTNTSGSYTHTTTIATTGLITEGMKCIGLEVGNPAAFGDMPTITAGNDEITLSCSSISGTSTVKVTMMRTTQATSSGIMPTAVTSEEFDILADRIGDIDDLTTTAKTDVVAAVNSLKTATDTISGQIVKAISASTDLNTILTPGYYNFGMAGALVNAPVSGTNRLGLIVQHSESDNYVYQMAFENLQNEHGVYTRRCLGGTWSSWEKLATNSQITTLNTKISTLSGSFKIKSANIPYTMSNGNFNTNVKTYIDNELATGEVCLGIVGYTTNSQYVFVASLYYPASAGNYTCQLGSRDNTSYSGTLSIRFLVYKPV